jgi:hypothetical protein
LKIPKTSAENKNEKNRKQAVVDNIPENGIFYPDQKSESLRIKNIASNLKRGIKNPKT